MTTSKNNPANITIMVTILMKYAIPTPIVEKIIPCQRTNAGDTLPDGNARSLVRSIMASISRSQYIFSIVEPETAKNRLASKSSRIPKSNLSGYPDIRYANIPVNSSKKVCFPLINSE